MDKVEIPFLEEINTENHERKVKTFLDIIEKIFIMGKESTVENV